MKHIIESWDEKIFKSALFDFYFDEMKVGVLDIETTGLNPSRNKFILGCLYDVTKGELHQVLAESRAEEPVALAEYLKLIENVDVVITFNGRHFDIPFIEKRWGGCIRDVVYLRREEQGPASSVSAGPAVYDLDIYQVLDKHSSLRKLLPNLKQKTVEDYMGFWMDREDEISGAESVELYNHYEATADPEAETRILLHNNDDVRQLTRLSKAITKSDFHKAMFHMGFPVKCGEHLLEVRNIKQTRNGLKVSGVQLRKPIEYMGFEFNGQPLETRFHRGEFEFTAPMVLQDEIDYRKTNEFIREFLKLLFEREIDI